MQGVTSSSSNNNTPPKAVTPRIIPGAPGTGSAGVGAMTPRDTIPLAKTPRKQRSSRFVVNEHVELERLPGLHGASASLAANLHPFTSS